MTVTVGTYPGRVGSAAISAIYRAHDVVAGLPGEGDATYMVMDTDLLHYTDAGAIPLGIVCAWHPAAGLMGEAAFAVHSQRHGGTPECADCGKTADMFKPIAVQVGFDRLGSPDHPEGGYRCITLPANKSYAWRGAVEVRGAGLCFECWLGAMASGAPLLPAPPHPE